MNPTTLLTLCQIGIAVFGIFTILCGYGAYHFARQADTQEAKQNSDSQKAQFEKAEVARQKMQDELLTKLESNNANALKEIENLFDRKITNNLKEPIDNKKVAERTFEVIKFSESQIFLRDEYTPTTGGMGTWFTPMGSIKPNKKFFLADLVGDIDRNRISLYITEDAKLVSRILTADATSHQIEVDISNWQLGEPHLLAVQWNTQEEFVDLNVDSISHKKIIPGLKFDRLGPLFLKGTDFEGNFPARLKEGGPNLADGLRKIGFTEFNRETR